MKLEVIVDDFGTYKKGDKFEAPDSTAKALIVHKVVKRLESKKEKDGKDD